jgi:hypothetical protein
MRALSIRQPWAWAILHAGKDVENRDWATTLRGEVLIHASKGLGKQECVDGISSVIEINPSVYDKWPGRDHVERGGIVGVARIVDCRLNRADARKSPWEIPGAFSFVLADVRPLPFIPCAGALGFWIVPPEVLEKVAAWRAVMGRTA